MKSVKRGGAVGQKVNPYGLRLGINKSWKSKWFVDPKDYAETLHQDLKLREIIEKSPESQGADVADVEIIRHPQRVTVLIHTGRPGAIIGVRGANIEKLGSRLQKVIGKKIQIKIKEIKRPELNAVLVAKNVARQLRSRSSFRRAMRMALQNAMRGGIQGIKIKIGGRLGGAEMSRSLEMKEGRIPLHTFRANIDYGFSESQTTFGTIGVKVWIFNGEVYGKDALKEDAGLLVSKQSSERAGSRR
jgi:small subunit ribosomal protein S3